MGKIIVGDNVSLGGILQDPAGDEGALLLARVQHDLTPLHTVSATLAGLAERR